MTTRPIFAAIQQACPDAFARLVEGGEAFRSYASADAIGSDLGDHLPCQVTVGDQQISIGRRPSELVPGSDGDGPLAGQVAVVSGAASGLGRGVATGLLEAGACVAFTDVDADGLAALAAELDEPSRVHTVVIDVTDEDSVAAGFTSTIERFGRIDAVACCAGIAPPYELTDFPVAKFRLACEINLTGYFLFAREGARVMKAQGHGGAMVFLSSKSGLEPSKANTAYNATKAGELHMARGWALELGRDGIRCNCIAPGNVFEGSKIWNPEYIAKAAQKKGIEPEEVIPYYNNLTALNAEIKPSDIANAAVFLCSEQSRRMTGQVLVVDSGQVWTR